MKPGPMGPGGKMTSTDNCEWFEGHYSVVCRSEAKTPMGANKSIGILGYNTEEKVYTYYGGGQHQHDHGQRPARARCRATPGPTPMKA